MIPYGTEDLSRRVGLLEGALSELRVENAELREENAELRRRLDALEERASANCSHARIYLGACEDCGAVV